MATEQEIHNWLSTYRRAWNQLCQALMWQLAYRFGTVRSTPGSAYAAAVAEINAGRMQGGEPPAGSFIYWDIGVDDHVGFVLNGGRILMASSKIDEEWVESDAGVIANRHVYEQRSGARYLGWSWQNGGNTVPFTAASTAGGGATPVVPPTPKENNVTTLFHYNKDNRRDLPATAFALAGDGAGPAGWLEISDQQLANELAGAHHISGRSVFLSTGTWAAWKAAYLGKQPVDASVTIPPVEVGDVSVSIDAKAVVDEYFRQLSERARD